MRCSRRRGRTTELADESQQSSLVASREFGVEFHGLFGGRHVVLGELYAHALQGCDGDLGRGDAKAGREGEDDFAFDGYDRVSVAGDVRFR
ncbi:hypothetical protein PBI_CHE9D_52 [Mycobacterium phage Che9d]|uniref:Uncharacterized protein n=1 Tax=Mycobacterium phage Che9d TaxID=2907834 RepID=Q855R1_9CAUD|nr:hypothetical protein PBI_CHE9D_52 [Mycobacterium phage Che9d]AAN07970.1 hypothetical protein PBI_CHE9D_52 [Mycobacterium phage Che9d]